MNNIPSYILTNRQNATSRSTARPLPLMGRGGVFFCFLCLFGLVSCGATSGGKTAAAGAKNNSKAELPVKVSPAVMPANMHPSWQPLFQRLNNDKSVARGFERYFAMLPAYSPDPMGVKVKELFTNAFLRPEPKKDDGKPKLPPSRIYRNIVTAANIQKCKDFLTRNNSTFLEAEKKHGVPKETLAALLYVETRLGTYIGKDNAFWSLASMAASTTPELVKPGISTLPITAKHESWLKDKLSDKSNWAYNEVKALINHCVNQELDPHSMPGSVYGAIGICQFMPSNLSPYGADGDGDGKIDLFSEADAIMSTANYLAKHGWPKKGTYEQQRRVLKRYNNLTVYANTIMALGESIKTGVILTGPPDAPKASSGKGRKAAVTKNKKSKNAAGSKAKTTKTVQKSSKTKVAGSKSR